MKSNSATDYTSTDALSKQLNSGRHTLLLVVIFTAINLVMLLLDAGSYFLFSASVPYYLTALCMGMDIGAGNSGVGPFTTVGLVISAVVLGMYLLCWLLSKKKIGWLVAAMVLFILDTLVLLGLALAFEDLIGNIMDLFFHAWVVISLIQAISASKKIRKAAAQQPYDGSGSPVFSGQSGSDPWDNI